MYVYFTDFQKSKMRILLAHVCSTAKASYKASVYVCISHMELVVWSKCIISHVLYHRHRTFICSVIQYVYLVTAGCIVIICINPEVEWVLYMTADRKQFVSVHRCKQLHVAITVPGI